MRIRTWCRVVMVVAVKCLDEGVDIPQVSQGIILAADASPRQFIQRRGRILRQPWPRRKRL